MRKLIAFSLIAAACGWFAALDTPARSDSITPGQVATSTEMKYSDRDLYESRAQEYMTKMEHEMAGLDANSNDVEYRNLQEAWAKVKQDWRHVTEATEADWEQAVKGFQVTQNEFAAKWHEFQAQ